MRLVTDSLISKLNAHVVGFILFCFTMSILYFILNKPGLLALVWTIGVGIVSVIIHICYWKHLGISIGTNVSVLLVYLCLCLVSIGCYLFGWENGYVGFLFLGMLAMFIALVVNVVIMPKSVQVKPLLILAFITIVISILVQKLGINTVIVIALALLGIRQYIDRPNLKLRLKANRILDVDEIVGVLGIVLTIDKYLNSIHSISSAINYVVNLCKIEGDSGVFLNTIENGWNFSLNPAVEWVIFFVIFFIVYKLLGFIKGSSKQTTSYWEDTSKNSILIAYKKITRKKFTHHHPLY